MRIFAGGRQKTLLQMYYKFHRSRKTSSELPNNLLEILFVTMVFLEI